jgi:hypothetical protein
MNERFTLVKKLDMETNVDITTEPQYDAKPPVISRASKIKKARDIAGKIFMLYDEKDKTGHLELDKATDAIYAYIKELEQS